MELDPFVYQKEKGFMHNDRDAYLNAFDAFDSVRSPSRLRVKLYYILVFSAIEIVLAFSWIGFITFPTISISTLHIPVMLAAIFFGRWAGCIVGGVYGFISIWKASNIAFVVGDAVFSPFLSGDPVGSLVTAVGMRMLFGFLTGWVYEELERLQAEWLLLAAVTYLLTRLQALLVFTSLGIFFPQLGLNIFSTKFFSIEPFFSGGLAVLLVPTLYYWCRKTPVGKRFVHAMTQTETIALHYSNRKPLFVFIGLLSMVSAALVAHFISRIQLYFEMEQYALPDAFFDVVWGWGIQFVVAMMSVSFLLFVVFMYFYSMTAKANHRSLLDSLTKLYHKEGIALQINHLLNDGDAVGGAFIMLDVDHFKSVNDRFGHPMGDQVLCKVADVLRSSVRTQDVVGRLGGDEFCLYLRETRQREVVLQVIGRIVEGVHDIVLPDGAALTCSIGVVLYEGQHCFNDFYWSADQALYTSKERGRNTYSFANESV